MYIIQHTPTNSIIYFNKSIIFEKHYISKKRTYVIYKSSIIHILYILYIPYLYFCIFLYFKILYNPRPKELNSIQFNRFDSVARNSIRPCAYNLGEKDPERRAARARGVSRHDCAQPLSDSDDKFRQSE